MGKHFNVFPLAVSLSGTGLPAGRVPRRPRFLNMSLILQLHLPLRLSLNPSLILDLSVDLSLPAAVPVPASGVVPQSVAFPAYQRIICSVALRHTGHRARSPRVNIRQSTVGRYRPRDA